MLVYRPARTLLIADLVHNVDRPRHPWARIYTRAMGFYDRFAISRMIRWTALSDRAAARRSLDELLTLPFDRLVVGHGAPLTAGALFDSAALPRLTHGLCPGCEARVAAELESA